MYLIRVKKINYSYKGRKILNGISFFTYPSELTGILGPSGSGKSTLIRVLLGFLSPSDGEVDYNENYIKEHNIQQNRLLGYVPQQDIIQPSLIVEQAFRYAFLLRYGMKTSSETLAKTVENIVKELNLTDRLQTRIKFLSGGERKRVNLGIELLTNPSILFLDEPTSGLDPHLDKQMMKLFNKLTSPNRTIFLTTHQLAHVSLLDSVIFIVKGYLVFAGEPSDALKYFEVDKYEDIYSRVRRLSPAKLANRFINSSFFKKYLHRAAPFLNREGITETKLNHSKTNGYSNEEATEAIKGKRTELENEESAIERELRKLKESQGKK